MGKAHRGETQNKTREQTNRSGDIQAITKESSFKYTTFLRNKHLLLATLSTAQKGYSLLRVTRHFNISPNQVLAIGDSHNDEDWICSITA